MAKTTRGKKITARVGKTRSETVFYLNGERVDADANSSRLMLADYLRERRGLVGTKIVCAEGDCGACSVLRYRPETANSQPLYVPINSCITTVAQMDGSSLITVEALATATQLHPAQKAMVDCHGSQCGFCTPGFVIAMTGLVEKKLCHIACDKKPNRNSITARDAKNAMTGNLCRCTGYQPIIEAAISIDLKKVESLSARYYPMAQEKDLRQIAKIPLHLKSANFELYAPTTIQDAAKYLAKNKTAKILAAATDLGVVHNKFKSRLSHVMSLHLIDDLNQIKFSKSNTVKVGARVTLSNLREALKDKASEFARFLDLFASPQIKNVATLVGNVANASPIADTPPFLLVSDAIVHIAGAPNKIRQVPIEKFFIDYRKTAVKAGEFITAVEFQLPESSDCLRLYKVSERKDLDISTVNVAFHFQYAPARTSNLTPNTIRSARLAVGGVAATTIRLYETEKFLKNKSLDPATIEKAIQKMQDEIKPIGDVRGSHAYRRILVENLFRLFASQK